MVDVALASKGIKAADMKNWAVTLVENVSAHWEGSLDRRREEISDADWVSGEADLVLMSRAMPVVS